MAAITHAYLEPGTYTATATASTGQVTLTDSVGVNVLEPRHYGDWMWVAMYPDASFYRGLFSVSLAVPEGEEFSATSLGIWSWEDADGTQWDVPYGLGLIGTFTAEGDTSLVTGLVDADAFVKLAAVDSDGVVGFEFEGDPSFYGQGIWYNYDGSQDLVDVAMRKVSKDLQFPPTYDYTAPSLEATAVRAAATPGGFGAARVDAPNDRLASLLSGDAHDVPRGRR